MVDKSKVIMTLNINKNSKSLKSSLIILLFFMIAISFLNGCGGGGGVAAPSEPLLEGVFIDSPVEGLEYETPTRTGMTDEDGTFHYYAGEMMRFYIGDIELGEAPAKSVMTPIDLVEGATDENHPAVINMARLLQTMDEDMDPENGITITEIMSNAMIDHMIDFNMDPDQFEYDLNVMSMMITMNEVDQSGYTRMMVSTEDALDHFSESMNSMMNDGSMMMDDENVMSSGGGMM